MKIFIGTLGTISFLILSTCILLDVAVAVAFVCRKGRNKRADYCFAGLLISFALTSLHQVFILQSTYDNHPNLLFLPVYFTLSFGVFLFYSVKLRLFPAYRFVPSDAKHLILPVGQFCYFLGLFLFTSPAYREELGRKFYSPFYGGLEMALYIATFYAYQFAAYRYIRFKITALRKKKEGGRPLFEAFALRRMLRMMLILFWINSAYIATDFVMYELLHLSMHNFRGFTRLGDLTYAAMAGWAGLTGLQLLSKQPYLNISELLFTWLKNRLRRGRV
ncbi:MAG: hypothetical protein H6577_10930 [Lewinellaceae bacterium]|nr:hypothetical protein [Saprospiraceae bacterium]MCB9338627.1 hypothetical protein [Lewinellaceae bacterium]